MNTLRVKRSGIEKQQTSSRQARTIKPLTIILLGDPAAGKATQAEFLAKHYHLYDFDMGKQLTVIRQKEAKISAVLKRNYDQVKITPSYIAQKILRDTINKVPKSTGILFDGH